MWTKWLDLVFGCIHTCWVIAEYMSPHLHYPTIQCVFLPEESSFWWCSDFWLQWVGMSCIVNVMFRCCIKLGLSRQPQSLDIFWTTCFTNLFTWDYYFPCSTLIYFGVMDFFNIGLFLNIVIHILVVETMTFSKWQFILIKHSAIIYQESHTTSAQVPIPSVRILVCHYTLPWPKMVRCSDQFYFCCVILIKESSKSKSSSKSLQDDSCGG